MNRIVLFCICLSSLLSPSCNCNSSSKTEGETSSQPLDEQNIEKRVIIIVDVSSSITEESKSLAVRYTGQIMNTLADESHLLIYTTEKNTAQQAIVDEKKSIPLRPSEKDDFNAHTWPTKVKNAKDTVDKNCKKGSSQSCILDGLKSVRTGLANASAAKGNYLLIISDMLECCALGCPQAAGDFSKMKTKLEKSDLSDFQLASKIPQEHVKICFINQNAKPGNANMIASPEFRAFWEQAFKMLGYSGMPEPGTSIASFLELIEE